MSVLDIARVLTENVSERPERKTTCCGYCSVYVLEEERKSGMLSHWETGYERFVGLVRRIADGRDVYAMSAEDALGALADAVSHDGNVDVSRDCDAMSGADFANLMSMCRRSQSGPYELIHYDQIAAFNNQTVNQNRLHEAGEPFPMWEAYGGLLAELRGIVIDLRTLAVVSNPYYKFRNMGESPAYSESAVASAIADNGGRMVATEKMDGSLIQLCYVGDESAFPYGLLASTSNTLTGYDRRKSNTHLAALYGHFIDADDRYLNAAKAFPGMTLCLEMVFPPDDPHVVAYDKSRWGLYLHGMREVGTGRIVGHDVVADVGNRFGIPVPPVVATDLHAATSLAKTWDGSAHEGMVLDIDGWLVKVKCEEFLKLSYMMHSLATPETDRGFRIIEHAVDDGTIDDMLANVPDGMRSRVVSVVDRLADFQHDMSGYVSGVIANVPDGCSNARAWLATEAGVPSPLLRYVFQAMANGGVDGLRFFAYDAKVNGEMTRQVMGLSDFERVSGILAEIR